MPVNEQYGMQRQRVRPQKRKKDRQTVLQKCKQTEQQYSMVVQRAGVYHTVSYIMLKSVVNHHRYLLLLLAASLRLHWPSGADFPGNRKQNKNFQCKLVQIRRNRQVTVFQRQNSIFRKQFLKIELRCSPSLEYCVWVWCKLIWKRPTNMPNWQGCKVP